MDVEQPLIQQETITLPPFESDVPVLHTPEGDYLPIRPLCEMLGLAPSVWIGLICSEFKPEDGVRAWPYRTPQGKSQATWCLKEDRFALWLIRLRARFLQGLRREQLVAFQEKLMDAADQLYTGRQRQYHEARQRLFTQFSDCNSGYATLVSIEEWVSVHLPHMGDHLPDADIALQDVLALLADGRAKYDAYRASLQRAMNEMLEEPIVDAFILDDEGQVADTVAMPIMPGIPDTSDIDALFEQVQAWWVTLRTWLIGHGLAANMPSDDERL